MVNPWWNTKFNGYFEHMCSIQRVLYHVEMTNKHVILVCTNCHKRYFYRQVAIENNTEQFEI
jgi:hypothetical protein